MLRPTHVSARHTRNSPLHSGLILFCYAACFFWGNALDTAMSAVPCSDDSKMGPVASAATGMLGNVAYVFPGQPCKGDDRTHERYPCHYECDTSDGQEGQWNLVRNDDVNNVTQSITWIAPASAAGKLANGTEVLFMVGGGTQQQPCNRDNCPGFEPLVAYNPDPSIGVVALSSDGAPQLALSTAAFTGRVLYVLGGIGSSDYNSYIYRFDTTTMRWLDKVKGGGDFTARIGLASVVIGNAIFTVGGHTRDTRKYSSVVEILDVGRPGDSPENAVMTWHRGNEGITPRAYAAAFTMGCKVYVAGGANDESGAGSSTNLNTIEIYSVPSGKTLAEGQWIVSPTGLDQSVSHTGAIVLRASASRQEMALVIGGLSGGDPGEPTTYCQSVAQPCDDPSLVATGGKGGPVQCDANQCAWGYVRDGSGSCAPCPGTNPLGSCGNGGCGGSFQSFGKCSWNQSLSAPADARKRDVSFIRRPVKEDFSGGGAVCKCSKKFFTGADCQSCESHRAGNDCTECDIGRFGPECEACPGLVGRNINTVCSGHGHCLGEGRTTLGFNSGKCECLDGWDAMANCTKCEQSYWGESCELCSCNARLTNATARKECPPSAPCSGHGHCVASNPSTSVCACDSGYSGSVCERRDGNGLGPGAIVAILLIVFGGIAGVFVWRNNLKAQKNSGGDGVSQALADPSSSLPSNYGTAENHSFDTYPPAVVKSTAEISVPGKTPSADVRRGSDNSRNSTGSFGNNLLLSEDSQADSMFQSLLASS